MFDKKKKTRWAPPVTQSPTPGAWAAWPRWQNENPVCYVLNLSFVRIHTKFGVKIFEIDFVIEIKWYLTLPQGPRGVGQKIFAVACSIHVSSSHTKFGWISSNGLWGDSMSYRRRGIIWFLTPKHPQAQPLGHNPGTERKSCLICFVSLICENTHKVLYNNLWNWLCNWN